MHHFLGHIKIKVHIGVLDEYSQYCIIVYTMCITVPSSYSFGLLRVQG